MWTADDWKDYELLDAEGGERLERWGKYILVRPDPQIIWHGERLDPRWGKADGIYRRSRSGGGRWVVSRMPDEWCIGYKDLQFKLRPMGFKHTGLFPEQAVNWDWFSDLIRERRRSGREVSVLRLQQVLRRLSMLTPQKAWWLQQRKICGSRGWVRLLSDTL